MIAQLPGVDTAVQTAAGRGWEAVLVVVLIAAITGLAGFLIRHIINDNRERVTSILADNREREKAAAERELRMAARIDKLEDELRNQYQQLATSCRQALDANSAAIAGLKTALESRPCFWVESERDKVAALLDKPAG